MERRYARLSVRLLLCLTSFVLAASGCRAKPKASDETLKQQILSNEPGPLRLPPAPIAADKLHEDTRSRALVLMPQASELEKRLPHFQLRIKLALEGTAQVGTRNEEHVWRRAKSGRFSVKHSGSSEVSEWILITPNAFVKHNKGEWRKRPFTIEHTETLKRDVVRQLAEPMSLFFDALTVSPPQTTSDGGRPAFRYKLGFTAPNAPGAKADKSAPAKSETKTGEPASAATMNPEVRPVELSGEIVVDKTTGVLLTAELKGTFELSPIPQPPPKPPMNKQNVRLKLSWNFESLDAGDEAKLEPVPPENAIVETGFNRPPADVLGFWGAAKKPGDEEREEGD